MAVQQERQAAEDRITANFGQEYDRFYSALSNTSIPEGRKALGAGRLALERAVLKTALENAVPPHALAGKLGDPGREPTTLQMIQKGREDMQRAFGQSPESTVAILAGRTANVDMPKGLGMSEDMRQLVNQGRKLNADIVLEQFGNRGRLTIDDERRGNHVGLAQGEKLPVMKEKLVNHMLFVNSVIDHGIKTGKLSPDDGKFLQDNVTKMVFNPGEQNGLSQAFKDFQQSVGPRTRDEIMKEVAERSRAPAVEKAIDKLYEAQGVPSPYLNQSKPAEGKGQQFAGKIIDTDAKHVYQELGKNNIVRHDRAAFDKVPERGQFTKIQYDAGKAQVVDKGHAQGQRLSLAR